MITMVYSTVVVYVGSATLIVETLSGAIAVPALLMPLTSCVANVLLDSREETSVDDAAV